MAHPVYEAGLGGQPLGFARFNVIQVQGGMTACSNSGSSLGLKRRLWYPWRELKDSFHVTSL
jgi:hypothetical protein